MPHALRDRRRVRILGAGGSGSERELLGCGLEAARGLPAALLFPGDVWAPDAGRPARAPRSRRRASSTRTRTRTGRRHVGGAAVQARLLPEFLLSSAYVGRPLAMGATVADQLPRLDATGTRRSSTNARSPQPRSPSTVIHIPEVLCHRTGTIRSPRGPRRSTTSRRCCAAATDDAGVVGRSRTGPLPHRASGADRRPGQHHDPIPR